MRLRGGLRVESRLHWVLCPPPPNYLTSSRSLASPMTPGVQDSPWAQPVHVASRAGGRLCSLVGEGRRLSVAAGGWTVSPSRLLGATAGPLKFSILRYLEPKRSWGPVLPHSQAGGQGRPGPREGWQGKGTPMASVSPRED